MAGGPQLTIRAGTPDICAGVLMLWRASGAEPSVTDTLPALLRLVVTDHQALLVAEIEGKLVGSVIAGWNGWRGSLYRLAVDPDHRRAGVATQLIRHAEHRLMELGAARIDAVVDQGDVAATRFWASVGYRPHQHRSRFMRDL